MLNKICTRPPSLKLRRLRDGKKHAIRQLAEHNLTILPGR
jgi:hypothetical protein